MVRTKREPAPSFSSRVPRRPARVLIITPEHVGTEAFAHLMLTCGIGCERIYRARSPDDAQALQARWATSGIRSQIVTFDDMATTAPEKASNHG